MLKDAIKKIRPLIIGADISILAALKKMDKEKSKLLFVFISNRFECILTIGDIQRAIIRNVELSKSVSFILDRNKEFSTKLMIDEMEKQYRFKNDVYQYTFIDEFEENNLLDEIDNRYHFESRSAILNKKP